ncbi:acyltransferase [Olsenella sp. kh2p3]|uniref:acyltransferase family protein n=1 Tax=Olsenella sp. kh2p3 TaxID=1797112 RepID=UPI0009133A8F|nr:acyltransferase [Olsenella sp. kh2p3]MCI2085258.1 acyltransferase [Olsenella sp.]SFW98919.1 Peptidoglycan/LPS O-acetylase OafA/YrhL, contains acyltransferase and SGNH-hydrolase domains [Olsenella sp. kh2p3]
MAASQTTAAAVPAAGKASSRRLPEYDLVRVVAMVFVVAVHSLMVVDTSVRAGVITEVAGQSLFFTANALFFLLSGRFNLRDVPEGKLGDFYLKKFRGVILPALVIFFVRALYDLRADPVSLRHVVGYFVRGSLGQYSGIEYWFIFSLAKLLLAAPFLAPAFAHLSPKRAKAFLGIGLAWFAVLFVCNNAGVDFSWDFLFSGFVFPFCLGPSIEELLSGRRARRALAVVAPLSWIATTYLVLQGWRTGAFDNSPLYMLLSFGIYIGLLSLGRRLAARGSLDGRLGSVISFVARHSFTVYLVHLMVLMPIAHRIPGGCGMVSLAFYPLVIVLVVLLSLGVAVVLDTVLVKPCQALLDRIVSRFRARGDA